MVWEMGDTGNHLLLKESKIALPSCLDLRIVNASRECTCMNALEYLSSPGFPCWQGKWMHQARKTSEELKLSLWVLPALSFAKLITYYGIY